MDREIPTCNPILANRIQHHHLQLHHQRLQNIKSLNRTRISTSLHHQPRYNKKAIQLHQDKQTQIQRDNLILFNRMLKIMKRGDPCNTPVPPSTRSNVRTSLEYNRIQQQNRTMYDRIEKQKPTIDHKKHNELRRKQQNILKFLGKYSLHAIQNAQTQSLRLQNPKQSVVNPLPKSTKVDYSFQKCRDEQTNLQRRVRYQQVQLQEQLDQEQINFHMQAYDNNKQTYSNAHANQLMSSKPSKINSLHSHNQTLQFNSDRKVPRSAKDIILFKSIKEIANQKYEIKIVRSHLAYEIRAYAISQDLQDPNKLVIQQHQGNQLLEANNYDYTRIVQAIAIKHNQLVFLQHHQQQRQLHQEEKYDNFHNHFNKDNPPKSHYNHSHISEQNQEESYRHPGSIDYSPPKPNPRTDSLGPQQNDQSYSLEATPKQSQNHLSKGGKLENKLQNFVQKGEQYQEQTKDMLLEIENNYEQALDQYIL